MKSTIGALAVASAMMAVDASAITYSVNRSFSDNQGGNNTATLIGTVDAPLGSVTIKNAGAAPFTAVNLTLTVNSTPYSLTTVDTSLILFDGAFQIDATPTELLFSATGDKDNPADLIFGIFQLIGGNYYTIGSDDYAPNFETATTQAGNVDSVGLLVYPDVFGVAQAPDAGSSLLLLALGFVGTAAFRAKR